MYSTLINLKHNKYNKNDNTKLKNIEANTLLLFQLDTLFYFPYIFTISFLQFSLHVSDRLVHHQENQITRAASGTFPSFVVISCVAVGAN